MENFSIHRDLLCQHSPFFRAALHSGMEESNSGVVSLPDDGPIEFAFVSHWIYHQYIPKDATDTCDIDELLRLWVLADKLLMPDLQDSLMNTMCDNVVSYKRCKNKMHSVTADRSAWIWDNTTIGSSLRNFYAEMVAFATLRVEDGQDASLPKDLLVQLVRRLMDEQAASETTYFKNRCRFHQHPKEEPCKFEKSEASKPVESEPCKTRRHCLIRSAIKRGHGQSCRRQVMFIVL